MERSYSQPDQAFSYNTLNSMRPRDYRSHAWAQLAKSDTFYIRGSPEERRLQRALGLDVDGHAGDAEDAAPDLEAQGKRVNTLPSWAASGYRGSSSHEACRRLPYLLFRFFV